jgi:histidine ammonia-lyase
MSTPIILDGQSLTPDQVVAVARAHARVQVDAAASTRAAQSRAIVERAIKDGRAVYGVNTGFGRLANVRIPPDQLAALQRNLILSHVAGVGDPLPSDVVRATMLLRANVLLKATSGVRLVLAERLLALLNAGIHPVVPEQGSVGASGDLAPLAHIALALLGEGDVDVAPLATAPRRMSASDALRAAGIAPVVLEAKEGIAFINGTQAQSASLALMVHDAERLWRNAHAAAAMSLEALRGTPDPFDPRIQAVRAHPGQVASAALLRDLLGGSGIRESHRTNDPRVQDAYSLRCTPQVLGAVADALQFARGVMTVEINAATDNPLVLGDDIVSGGNFHGQPVAQALDFLAIALTTLAGLAERRLDRLMNPDLSYGLPPFLTANAGLQSGLMMVQVTAAALTAECRTLSTPASVQSISTEANQEDFVPMGMTAANKCRRVLASARRVVACELIAAAQGVEYHRPLKAGAGVERALARVRHGVLPLTVDRPQTPDIEWTARLLADESLA